MLISKQNQLHGRSSDGLDTDLVVQGLKVGGSFLKADAIIPKHDEIRLAKSRTRLQQSSLHTTGTSNKSNINSRTGGNY